MRSAKRIVLVQEDAYLVASRKAILEQNGYQVDGAHSVEEARALCRLFDCDLVIVDSEENFRAATELCEEIKAENPDISVAVMTWDAANLESDCPDEIIRRRKGPQELLDKVAHALA
jgi:DNA-binding response OmpR family regulator